MQHNDLSRTGQNLDEFVLKQANVNVASFGKLATLPVDGLVYAQPLVVTSTTVNGSTHDVLLVATMHNSVYAFDANAWGAPLWHVQLGPSVPSSAIGPINPSTGKHDGTQNIQVEVGILSTPVVDRTQGLIYLSLKNYDASTDTQTIKLHVLDLATGADAPGSPVTVTAQVQGTGASAHDGVITMDPGYVAQRPGLLLLNGTVYLAFASHEDYQPYHGWILGYSYSPEAHTLTQSQVFCVTPDGAEGGIWNGGQGLVSDGTSIYALVANGTVTVPTGGQSYGESFLKLSPDLSVEDWFIPVNYGTLNEGDIDLGSGGPVLIPGTDPPLVTGGGKQGILYVVDTTNMGHLGTVDDKNTQEWPLVAPPELRSIYGAPVVWTGSGSPALFVWAEGDYLRKFTMTNGLFDTTPSSTNSVSNIQIQEQDPVGTLAVSSDGSVANTGIVWAVRPDGNPVQKTVPGTFYAYSADDLTELWDSGQNATRDGMGNYAKFVPPTVANGKVFLATHSGNVLVYGLLHSDD